VKTLSATNAAPVSARTPATEIEAIAAAWVLRIDSGLDSAGDGELARWRAADPRHESALSRLTGTWEVFDRAEQKGLTCAIITQLEKRAREQRTRRKGIAALAGGVTALVLLAFWPRTSFVGEVASAAQMAKAFESIQKLPDGTIVELNDGAAITVQYEPAIRRVHLVQGEALFRVQKDPARPFLVLAGGIEVRAVGTAFNIQLGTDAVEVLVTEGKVRVGDAIKGTSLLPPPQYPADTSTFVAQTEGVLVAGERVIVDLVASDSPPVVQVASLASADIEQRLAWRIPRLEFNGMKLDQAVEQINRYNRLQIILGDPAIGRLRISGVFRSDNPDGFVRIVEATFGLRSERTGEHGIALRPGQ